MKSSATRTSAFIALILLVTALASCSQEPIFYDISREVKLSDPVVTGHVISMVPLDGKLYTENGYIYRKADPSKTHGWTKISGPEASSKKVTKLASDSAYLYALTEDKAVYAMYSAAPSWTKVAEGVTTLFDNQVFNTADLTTTGRNAYIVTAGGVKQLAGATSEATLTTVAAAADTTADTFGKAASEIKAAACISTGDVFSSNAAFAAVGDTLYSAASNATTIRYKIGAEAWKDGGKTSSGAVSLCSAETAGVTKLLVGTNNGYEICALNADVPANGVTSSTNAETSFSQRRVLGIWQYGSIVYAGVMSTETSYYSALWAYNGTQWNRE